jgi:hypothetical protein
LDCIDLRIGQLLQDAKSDALLDPGREEERTLFFDKHVDKCLACREALLEHASELAIEQVARDRNIETGDVLGELRQAALQLERVALDNGISFEDALRLALSESNISTASLSDR